MVAEPEALPSREVFWSGVTAPSFTGPWKVATSCALPMMLPHLAEIVYVPGALTVALPFLSIVSVPKFDGHDTFVVTSRDVPSENEPVAVKLADADENLPVA